MSTVDPSMMTQPPTGQQYGQRQATEQSLAEVPMGPGEVPAGAQPAAADPRQATEQYQPPTGLMNMEDDQMSAATAGLPLPSAPASPMPEANREALAMLPMMPTFERIAAMPSTGAGFRRWYANLKAQIPPEATVRSL